MRSILKSDNNCVNKSDWKGQTALHSAAEDNDLTKIKKLLLLGANVDSKDDNGKTPLHLAAIQNKKDSHLGAIKALLRNGADVNVKDEKGNTALHHLAWYAGVRTLRLILSFGADVDVGNFERRTALFTAVVGNNLEVVRLLIKHRSDVNWSGFGGLRPLHLAILVNNIGNSHLKAVKTLLRSGADVNAQDSEKKTPLHYLTAKAQAPDLRIFTLFLKWKAEVNVRDLNGETPLFQMVRRGHLNVVKLLLSHGSDLGIKGRFGSTVLHEAAERHGRLDILEILLKSGANVNALDSRGRTALHFLVRHADVKVVQLFLDYGADVNAQDAQRETPLFNAIRGKNQEVIDLLMDRRPDVGISNLKKGTTPLHLACLYSCDKRTIKLLLKRGARVDAIDSKGNAPLKCLVNTSNSVKTLKFMLEYADVNVIDAKGENMMFFALRENTWRVIVEHIAKLRALDLTVHPGILKTISSYGNLNDYFAKCAEELERMKNTRLQNCWISFFNLLVDSKRKLKNYAGNPDVDKVFTKMTNCSIIFPIYGESIQRNMEKSLVRRRYFDNSAVQLSDKLPIFNPTHLIVRDILDCLTFEDYSKLVLGF